MSEDFQNKRTILIMGPPTAGKTHSLMALENQDKYAYFNADRKQTPFKHDFMEAVIREPMDILGGIQEIEQIPEVEGVIIDTVTKLMENFESMYVAHATDTRAAWGSYSTFYRDVANAVLSGTKSYVTFAHMLEEENVSKTGVVTKTTKSTIKGAAGKIGIEADYSIILTAKRLTLEELEGVENPMFTITEDDKDMGCKYVFATRLDADTVGDKTRSPIGMWDRSEKYIDNNLTYVFQRLNEYYA